MKTFLIASFACLLALVSSARADEPPRTTYVTIENQNLRIDGSIEPGLNGTIVRMLYGPIGVYGSYYVDRTHAEALVGPLFSPKKWLTIGSGVGVEQADGTWRVGGMIWLGFEKYVSTTFIETGASGFWARGEFAWKPRPWIGLGALGDTALGYGPRVEINVPRTPLQIWGAALYAADGDTSIPAFGVRLNL